MGGEGPVGVQGVLQRSWRVVCRCAVHEREGAALHALCAEVELAALAALAGVSGRVRYFEEGVVLALLGC